QVRRGGGLAEERRVGAAGRPPVHPPGVVARIVSAVSDRLRREVAEHSGVPAGEKSFDDRSCGQGQAAGPYQLAGVEREHGVTRAGTASAGTSSRGSATS